MGPLPIQQTRSMELSSSMAMPNSERNVSVVSGVRVKSMRVALASFVVLMSALTVMLSLRAIILQMSDGLSLLRADLSPALSGFLP